MTALLWLVCALCSPRSTDGVLELRLEGPLAAAHLEGVRVDTRVEADLAPGEVITVLEFIVVRSSTSDLCHRVAAREQRRATSDMRHMYEDVRETTKIAPSEGDFCANGSALVNVAQRYADTAWNAITIDNLPKVGRFDYCR